MAPSRSTRRTKSARPSPIRQFVVDRSPLFLSTCAFVVVWLLVGGGVAENQIVFILFALSGSWLLGFALANGAAAEWRDLSWPARLAVLFACLIPLLQCIPLPPEIWRALPGRGVSADTLTVAGIGHAWHPITLGFEATFRSFLMTAWLVGLLLAVLGLPTAELQLLFKLLLGLGALHLLIGLLQVASGGRFLFYDVPNVNFLLGFFANKNHSGLFLAMIFPIGYVALYGERGWGRARLPLVIGATLVLLAALILTFSRAGLFFGVIAFVFLLLLTIERRLGRLGRVTALAVLVALALLAVLASTDLAARSLGRFAGVGSDPRWLFWSWSRELVPVYFPVGSGVGSFPDVFKVLERLTWVKPTYLNHAHNDYLEQLIEMGAAAPILWLLAVAALVPALASAWRDRARSAGRIATVAGLMVVLVLLHSAFDYPLRRPGLAAVFVIALGALLRRRSERKIIA